MSARNPNDILDELTASLQDAEGQQRRYHNEALDMEDEELSKTTQHETYSRIRKIRGWLQKLSDLRDEFSEAGLFLSGQSPAQERKTPGKTINHPREAPREKSEKNALHTAGSPVFMSSAPTAANRPKLDENPAGHPSSEDLNSMKPSSFSLLGKIYPVNFWHEILIKVCEVMIFKKPFVMANLDKDAASLDLPPQLASRLKFSYRDDEIKTNKTRLSNNLWIDTAYNAGECLTLTRSILSLCGFKPEELTVEYKQA
ncbi:MAG: hypothetical protein LBR61_07385 [Synergistaceae bacterium]|jgi:hypothetical protein|nr:hypothetical protein [Synergistaceae bacterium]